MALRHTHTHKKHSNTIYINMNFGQLGDKKNKDEIRTNTNRQIFFSSENQRFSLPHHQY